jgi:hypothetical protein
MNAIFCPNVSEIPNIIALSEGSQAFSACPVKKHIKM